MPESRKRSVSLKVDLPSNNGAPRIPPIAAIFLIKFDLRTGYVVEWKESVGGVTVDGVVEFKSLPSGLHNVKEDLIYFVQDEYAGLSAFVNEPAAESERNALMLAVGVLVPLSYGRLGKIWRHASALKELARELAVDATVTTPLSEYWEEHRVPDDDPQPQPLDSPLDSPAVIKFKPNHDEQAGYQSRVFSDPAALFSSQHHLTPYHPALSLPEFMSDLGPLVFPLYKLALLRKRILILCDAPVQLACNFVYDLSILSSISRPSLSLIPSDSNAATRLRPLFNIGIHDIPSLMPSNPDFESAWVACTTDAVLATKSDLYDVLVHCQSTELDPSSSAHPHITSSQKTKNGVAVPIKATQRDARRFHTLRHNLRRLPRTIPSGGSASNTDNAVADESAAAKEDDDGSSTASLPHGLVEPVSWPVLAYTSFIWWASAGEKRNGPLEDEDEVEHDTDMLLTEGSDLSSAPGPSTAPTTTGQPKELALVAYFHRWTSVIFQTLADAVVRSERESVDAEDDAEAGFEHDEEDTGSDSGDDENAPLMSGAASNESEAIHEEFDLDDEAVEITTEEMITMGLDVWSQSDRAFVEEMLEMWFGRRAKVLGPRIECCGVRLY